PPTATKSTPATANPNVFNECVDALGRKRVFAVSFAFFAKGTSNQSCNCETVQLAGLNKFPLVTINQGIPHVLRTEFAQEHSKVRQQSFKNRPIAALTM